MTQLAKKGEATHLQGHRDRVLGAFGRLRQARRAGFTHVEIIVAAVIAAILIIAVATLITSLSTHSHKAQHTLDDLIADSLVTQAFSQFEDAVSIEKTGVPAFDSTATPDIVYLYIGDSSGAPRELGHLFMRRAGTPGTAIEVFWDSFYQGRVASMQGDIAYSPATGKYSLTLTVRLFDTNGTEVSFAEITRQLPYYGVGVGKPGSSTLSFDSSEKQALQIALRQKTL